MKIELDTELRSIIPGCKLGYVRLEGVIVASSSPELEEEFRDIQEQTLQVYRLEELTNLPRIKAVRNMYKRLRFDPGRYRPSSEALVRRILQNKGLYHVNTAVDVNNYSSVKYLLTFGLYDADHIRGNVRYAVAQQGTYVNIAGNEVSTEGKPFLCDDQGVFGNPTSDARRTCVTENTKSLLIVVYADEELSEVFLTDILRNTGDMMVRYNGGHVIEQGVVTV